MENSEGSPSCCDSVCSVCELIPPALLQAIPAEFKRIKFEELQGGEDYSQSYVVGRVFQTFPISKRAKGFFRKLLLCEAGEKPEEDKSSKRLNMFILNENEKQLDSIDQKSFVAVSGFKVEKLTQKNVEENIIPVQVLVIIQSDSNDSTMMWIARSVAAELDDSTCSPVQDSADESMECDDPRPLSPDEEDFHALVKEYSQRESPLSDESDEVSIESEEFSPLRGEVTEEVPQISMDESPNKRTDQQNDVAEQPNPVPESSGRRYHYVQLNKLEESLSPDQNFNIYGIVVNCYFKPSAPDRDKVLELIMKDSTMDFFRCRVIGKCTDKFPDVYPGDIIRIHRMLVDKFRDKFKGKCFSPKFIIVFDGKTNDYEPRCVAKTFVFTQDDKKMVQNLRTLAKEIQAVKLISKIEMDDFVSVICQVVSIYTVRNDSVLLKVWDGTISPILDNEKVKSIIRGRLDERLFNVAKNYLVAVWINGDYTIAALGLKPGQYVKLCDVHLYAPKTRPDEPRLCIHPQTKLGRGIEPLDTKDDILQELKSRLQKVWEEAGVTEEITMDDTPSFMKDVDTSNVTSSDSIMPTDAVSRFDQPGTSGENMRTQQSTDSSSQEQSVPPLFDSENLANASQAMKAADLASQQLFISTLNQGIEPASSMELASGAPSPTVNGQLSCPQESMEVTAVDEGYLPPSDRGKSPVMNERGKRANLDSEADNASKKQKVDNHVSPTPASKGITPHAAVSPTPASKDITPHAAAAGHDDITPAAQNQADLSAPHLITKPSPLKNSSTVDQPDRWRSVQTVSETIGHQHIEPSFLNNVVKHFVPYKFRLFVTVLNIEPQLDSIQKLIRVYCPKCHYLSENASPNLEVYETRNNVAFYLCPECSSGDSSIQGDESSKPILEYTFLVCFSLHDGTSTIDAYIWRENAVKFFKGIRPEDALTDSSQATLVRQMLWDVCPNCCPFQPTNGKSHTSSSSGSYYPILDCCVMSYTAGDKTRYQVFDTRLK